VSGMAAATLLGIFFVPSLFVFIERLGGHKDAAHAPSAGTAVPLGAEPHGRPAETAVAAGAE